MALQIYSAKPGETLLPLSLSLRDTSLFSGGQASVAALGVVDDLTDAALLALDPQQQVPS